MRGLAAIALLLWGCGDKAVDSGVAAPVDTGEAVDDRDIDLDGDGVGIKAGDCGDRNPTVYPGAPELCDGLDNDCDGSTDEGLEMTLYRDLDGDGYGDPAAAVERCELTGGYVENADDCDDENRASYPGSPEICDEIDNDCDGTVDDPGDVDGELFYVDADGDGSGDADTPIVACRASEGVSADADDCDDTDADRYPLADERCDDIDNDCDGFVDESDAVDATDWRPDADLDGYGAEDGGAPGCVAPSGYVDPAAGVDCDDVDPLVNPGVDERCDEIDNNCDGDVDEVTATDAPTWYTDVDADGYGDDATANVACYAVSGEVALGGDCDDADDGVYPDADEHCDGVDEDCDGSVDEAGVVDGTTWYPDVDADGYGDEDAGVDSCVSLSGYTVTGGDCDDTDSAVSPGESEVCSDGIDNDCDGAAVGCGLSGTYDVDVSADVFLEGESAGAQTGYYSSPGAGDGDGDGVDDVLIGAAGYSSYTGRAYVELGPVTIDRDLSRADGRMSGASTGDRAGYRVRWAGDLDSDGNDDILVSAWGNDDGGTDAGAVYVVAGPGLRGTLSLAAATLTGATAGDHAGSGVAAIGDINGDGYDDVLVGASGEDTAGADAGAAYVVFGPVTSDVDLSVADVIITGEAANDQAGSWVAAAGDVNGDGTPDVLIGAVGAEGAVGAAGAVYLIYGPITADLSLASADVKLGGVTAYDYAGFSVAGVGDVDADGYDDVVVGAYGVDGVGSSAGAAYLFRGPITADFDLSSADAVLSGNAASDYAGFSVAGAGDVNGDGFDDVLVGAWRADVSTAADSGEAYLLYGPITADLSLSAADVVFQGGAASDYLGSGVSGVGDVNGDGYDDVMIGAHGQDDGGSGAGAGYLFFGDGI